LKTRAEAALPLEPPPPRKGKTVEAVEKEAFANANSAMERGATGFQIQHLNGVDQVVAIAHFGDDTTD
jgi:hypothetical protein